MTSKNSHVYAWKLQGCLEKRSPQTAVCIFEVCVFETPETLGVRSYHESRAPWILADTLGF